MRIRHFVGKFLNGIVGQTVFEKLFSDIHGVIPAGQDDIGFHAIALGGAAIDAIEFRDGDLETACAVFVGGP